MIQMFSKMGAMVEVVDAWLRPAKPERRWNCKCACKRCGAKTSALGRKVLIKTVKETTEALALVDGRLFEISNGFAYLPCRGGCGRVRAAFSIDGKFNAGKACNAKCMGACGPSCECRCAGKNHGAAFSL
jgi:hypothetical protein